MKLFLISLVSILLLALTGCVYLDIASQDTAVPIYPKKVDVSMHLSTGVSITDTYFIEEESDTNKDMVRLTPIGSWKAAIGVSPKIDLLVTYADVSGKGDSADFWSNTSYSYESNQVKCGVKCLLSQNAKNYVAILPSIYVAKGNRFDYSHDSYGNNLSILEHYEFETHGLEGQLLMTSQMSKFFSATLVTRAQYNSIQKTLNGRCYPSKVTFNGGMRGNCKISAGIFYLLPEIGFEVFPIVNGETDINPIVSFGFGLKL